MNRKDLRRLLWAGLALVALPGLVRWMELLGKPVAYDFAGYFDAARRFAAGERNLYTITTEGVVPYLYPPLFAVLMQPFSLLAFDKASDLWFLFNVSLTVASYRLVGASLPRRLARQEWLLLALAFAAFPPLFRTIRTGQVLCILLFLLAVAAWAQSRQRDSLAGTAFSVASAIKVYPAIYLLTALAQRRVVLFLSGFAAGIVLVALSLLVGGWDLHISYIRDLLPRISSHVDTFAANQSIAGAFFRWGIVDSLLPAIVSAVFVILTLYLAYRAGTGADLLVMTLATIAALLVPTFSWDLNYLILLVPFSLLYFSGVLQETVLVAYGLVTLERYWVLFPNHWIFQLFGVAGALVLWFACALAIVRRAPTQVRNVA